MRIARFVSEFPAQINRGLAPNYFLLSEAQRKLGNDVSIFAMRGETAGGNGGGRGKIGDIPVHAVKRPRLARVFAGLNFMDALAYSGFDADIVHAVNPLPFGWFFSHARGKIKSKKTKFALSIHGSLKSAELYGPRGIASMRDSVEFGALAKFLARRVDVVMPVAEFIKREFIEAGIPEHKLKVVPSGVDFTLFSGAKRGPRSGSNFTVLYAGRFAQKKGLPYLLRAAEILKKEGVRFVLAGGVETDNDYATVVSLISSLGLSESVEILPPVPHTELPALYRGADAFVLPSLIEPRAKVLWEAMAAGTPVIATAQGGVPETIEHMRNGLIVPPADAEGIANAIRELRNDKGLAKSLASGGRKTAMGFDWSVVARKYNAVFEGIM